MHWAALFLCPSKPLKVCCASWSSKTKPFCLYFLSLQLPTSSSSPWWSESPLLCSWALSSSRRWPAASWSDWRGSAFGSRLRPSSGIWTFAKRHEEVTHRTSWMRLSKKLIRWFCLWTELFNNNAKIFCLYLCFYIPTFSEKDFFFFSDCCVAHW